VALSASFLFFGLGSLAPRQSYLPRACQRVARLGCSGYGRLARSILCQVGLVRSGIGRLILASGGLACGGRRRQLQFEVERGQHQEVNLLT